MTETRTVTIPARPDHRGDPRNARAVTLRWACPVCGAQRGAPVGSTLHDQGRRLFVDGWVNPCGHAESYDEVRREAAVNGLN